MLNALRVEKLIDAVLRPNLLNDLNVENLIDALC